MGFKRTIDMVNTYDKLINAIVDHNVLKPDQIGEIYFDDSKNRFTIHDNRSYQKFITRDVNFLLLFITLKSSCNLKCEVAETAEQDSLDYYIISFCWFNTNNLKFFKNYIDVYWIKTLNASKNEIIRDNQCIICDEKFRNSS